MTVNVDLHRLREAVAGMLSGSDCGNEICDDDLRRFASAGLAALARRPRWTQFGVAPNPGRMPDLYAAVADAAEGLLAGEEAENFFFMHKPPGLRIRFAGPTVSASLPGALASWQRDGLVSAVEPGIYEPEEHLFGGPESMHHVHRLFTLDSLAWLAFHRLAGPVPVWGYSLALLRHVFDGLGIVGWEDLGVWERIRRQGGRSLPSGMDEQKLAHAAEMFRQVWSGPDRVPLPPDVSELAGCWGRRLAAAAADWSTGYFGSGNAVIGPREGAAFTVIFHWNRGRLSGAIQAMLTCALADRGARP